MFFFEKKEPKNFHELALRVIYRQSKILFLQYHISNSMEFYCRTSFPRSAAPPRFHSAPIHHPTSKLTKPLNVGFKGVDQTGLGMRTANLSRGATLALALTLAIAQPAGANDLLPLVPEHGDAAEFADILPPEEQVVIVRRGDTLSGLLLAAGIEAPQAHAAVAAVTPLFPARALREGQEVTLRTGPNQALLTFEIDAAPGRSIRVAFANNRWQAQEHVAPQQRMLALAAGTVDGGLFPAAVDAGLPPALAMALIGILGHQIDFQRDLQPGDRFAILFERLRDPEGELLGHGRLLGIELELSGKTQSYWRADLRNGTTDWVDANGRSLRRSFLRTPLDGARVSSGFGMRNHPILGYTAMHRGTDFAAPAGTPVYAAADGVVISARFDGGYGRLIRLRHANGTETRYAHLSAFTRGLGPGSKVRQGQVIGRVGSTGMSTGPHLHFEILVAGKQVNPARHHSKPAQLAGRDLAAFQKSRKELARLAAGLTTRTEIALAD
jgi:murein DD-endopeptidase MepM/ murein hydrolase activator NlpD